MEESAHAEKERAGQSMAILVIAKRVLWRIRSRLTGSSVRHLFIHYIDTRKGYPEIAAHADIFEPTPDDVLLAERILRSFKKAQQDEEAHRPRHKDVDIWDHVKRHEHRDFYAVYRSGDAHEMAAYLCNLLQRGLGLMDWRLTEYARAARQERLERTALIKDALVGLGEAVGALDYSYPTVRDHLFADSRQLVRDIAQTIGIDIAPPRVDGGLMKAKMGDFYFSLRDIYSLYEAWRIDQLLADEAGEKSICEIGGGLGKVALYARRFGLTDYSIFDLPTTNIVQAWILAKSGIPVALYGEDCPPDSVRILPYWAFDARRSYALTLNADSFAEIDAATVARYLQVIRQNTTRYFLSINQEHADTGHIVVPRIIKNPAASGRGMP